MGKWSLEARKKYSRRLRKLWKDPIKRREHAIRIQAMWNKKRGITQIDDYKVTICKYCKRPF